MGVPATYVQATPDLMMGDLLKNMRSSQIFSVCGLPEVEVATARTATAERAASTQVDSCMGLDVFDPVTMEVDPRRGDDVPAWFLDTDYNDLCFHVSQAFFPRTGPGTTSSRPSKAVRRSASGTTWPARPAPVRAGEHEQDRGQGD